MLDATKQLVRETLGSSLYSVVVELWSAVFPFILPGNLHWIFVVSTVAIAGVLYLRRRAPGERASLGGFGRFLVPRAVFLHASAVLDYKFYVVNVLILNRLGLWVAMLVGMLYAADRTRALLDFLLGPAAALPPSLAVQVGYTVALALVLDFAVFFAHWLQHRIPLLWHFHKIHHAAEVLTPITKYRFHPVDSLLEEALKLLLGGIVTGVFAHLWPQSTTELTILTLSAITFVFFLQNHLRHSHIRLEFGPRTSQWLSSPTMYQIHHSAKPEHADRNLALIFSFWDRLFGTLYVPRRGEAFHYGLIEADDRYSSVWRLYTVPFVDLIRTRARGAPARSRTAS